MTTKPHGKATQWLRVTKADPCPICERPDWCCTSRDGTAAYCMRAESDRPVASGGWIHAIDGRPTTVTLKSKPKRRRTDIEQHNRWAPLARHCFAGRAAQVETLAATLGVASWTLDALHIGYGMVGDTWCWTFPERNHQGFVVGINRRLPDGSKRCTPGSRRGLTYVDD